MTMISPEEHPPVEPTERKAMTPKRRNTVALRQEHRCAVCGIDIGWGFEVDHALPLELGGKDADDNLQALCVPCHKIKTREDMKRIRKAARIRRRAEGREPVKQRIRSGGFRNKDPLRGER